MNKLLLARTTFVLDRKTHDRLDKVSRRFGVSRSSLVRDILAEPMAMAEKWVDGLPETPTEEDKAVAIDAMQMDLEAFLARELASNE